MGVFPVVDNLLHVVERVEQEVITPFSPVNGHSAVPVHTGSKNTYITVPSVRSLSASSIQLQISSHNNNNNISVVFSLGLRQRGL